MNGVNGTLSNSRAWCFATCPTRYFYKYLLNIKPLPKTQHIDSWTRFTKGIAIHAGMQAVFLQQDIDAGVASSIRDVDSLTAEQQALWPTISYESAEIARDLAEWLPASDFKPLTINGKSGVEIELRQPMNGFSGGWVGYADLVAEHVPTGRRYLIDFKTKASFSADGGLQYMPQFRQYMWALHKMGTELDGAMMIEAKSSLPKRAPRKIREDIGDYSSVRESVDGRFRVTPMLFSKLHLERTWKALEAQARVMAKTVAADCWPNESAFGCATCEFNSLCEARFRGYEVADVLKENFRCSPSSLAVLNA